MLRRARILFDKYVQDGYISLFDIKIVIITIFGQEISKVNPQYSSDQLALVISAIEQVKILKYGGIKDFMPDQKQGLQFSEYLRVVIAVEKYSQPRAVLIYDKFDRSNKGYICYSDFWQVWD